MRAIDACGSVEGLARRTDIAAQYLSQIRTGGREMGAKTARRIETAMDWREGAMDRPPAGVDLDQELAHLLSIVDETAAIQAIVSAVPGLSPEGVQALTAALLKRLQHPSDVE